ncbi:ABC transporter ATP-binding protein [Treponema sp. Marseille-Q3903]|nr:ABC transporter ATP-binding protein [Treponema sp. Marseille-Q3903]
MALIELNNINFQYDDIPSLVDISLSIEKGESVGLEGDNGSGKSTLIKLLNGLIFASSGTYFFEGKEISKKTMKDELFEKQFHSKIGYVFQNSETQLFCGSVKEEIAFGPRQMGLAEDEIEIRCSDVMKLLGLTAIAERAPYHLSGGEKRKTALACVISMNPDVLIIDEPMNGLDKKSRVVLIDFLKAWKSAGKTLIIATHEQSLLNELVDRIVTITEEHRIG